VIGLRNAMISHGAIRQMALSAINTDDARAVGQSLTTEFDLPCPHTGEGSPQMRIVFDFDPSLENKVIEWSVMPSGRIVVIAEETEGFPESYWFNANGKNPKSRIEGFPIPMAVAPCPHAATVCQLSEALEMLYDKWENGTPCYDDPEECSGFLGNAFELSEEEEAQALRALEATGVETILRLKEGAKAAIPQCPHAAEVERLRKLCGEALAHVEPCWTELVARLRAAAEGREK
jgi:DNA-binding transcriptional ArsR family regulator